MTQMQIYCIFCHYPESRYQGSFAFTFFFSYPIFKVCIQLPESAVVLSLLSDPWTKWDGLALFLRCCFLFFSDHTIYYNYEYIIITPSTQRRQPCGVSRGCAGGKSEAVFSALHLQPEEVDRHFARQVGTNDTQRACHRADCK